jgi:hypothetical protein
LFVVYGAGVVCFRLCPRVPDGILMTNVTLFFSALCYTRITHCFVISKYSNSFLIWGPLNLVSTIEELLGRKCSGFGLERQEYGLRDPSC